MPHLRQHIRGFYLVPGSAIYALRPLGFGHILPRRPIYQTGTKSTATRQSGR